MFLDILCILRMGKNLHVHIFIHILKNLIPQSLRISSPDSVKRKSLSTEIFNHVCKVKDYM